MKMKFLHAALPILVVLVTGCHAGEGPSQVSESNVGDITNVNVDFHVQLENEMDLTIVTAILGLLNKQDIGKNLPKLPELEQVPEIPADQQHIVPKALWKFKKVL